MKNIIYIDCYATIGKRGQKDELAAWRTETLLEEMDYSEIHGAVVVHALSKEYDPMFGNKALLKELKKSDRLFGCWAAMPDHCGDFPKPKEFIKMMKDNNIKCASLFPRLHNYLFNPLHCGELIKAFIENDIPVLIQSGVYDNYVQTNFKEIDTICAAFPDLKIIILGTRWEQPRQLVPTLLKHKNLYTEFSSFQLNRAVEWFTELYGDERLLFGAEFPEKCPGAAKAFIDYAEISMASRKKIAGENIVRLLKIKDMPKEYSGERNDDEVLKLVKEGKPLDNILVIDSHAHMSHDDCNGVGYMPQLKSDIKGIINRNRLMGIDQTCISGQLAVWAEHERGNDIVFDAMNQFPGKVIGYASFNPDYGIDWEAELKKVYEVYKFKGLKPYKPRTLIPYNSPKYNKWFEYGNQRNLFCLNHPVDNFKNEMLDVAARFQNIYFLLAHSGWSFKTAREHIEIAKERQNTFLEITFTAVTYGSIEYMVKELGAGRVLFGTDQPFRDPIPQFGWVAYSHLSGEEKIKILGSNMQKIINRCKI